MNLIEKFVFNFIIDFYEILYLFYILEILYLFMGYADYQSYCPNKIISPDIKTSVFQQVYLNIP